VSMLAWVGSAARRSGFATGAAWPFAAALVLMAAPLAAQEKPAVVIAIASLDETMADVTYATEAAGVPQFAGLVQFMSAQYTQALDRTKPAGAIVSFKDNAPTVLAFIPVKDMQQLLNLASQQLGPPEDAGNGIKRLNGPQPLYVKEAQGYAFLSNDEANVQNPPANPVAMLFGAEKKYNISVAVNLQSIPEPLRQMAAEQIKAGFEAQLQNLPEEQRAAQEQLTGNSLNQLIKMMNEAESFGLGLAIDKATKSSYIDVSMTAVSGTDLAKQFAAMNNLKTDFAGFTSRSDAAAVMSFTGKIADADKGQLHAMLGTLKAQALEQLENDTDLPSDEARAAAKEVLESLFTVIKDTVDDGVMDGGAVLSLDEGSVRFAAGMHVADGKAIQAAFEKILELAKDDPEVPEVKLNAAKHGDVVFHTMNVPIPDPDAQKALGETMQVALGTAPNAAYLTFGKGGIDLVKQAIDSSKQSSGSAAPPAQIVISLKPILEFAQKMQEQPAIAGALAALEQANGLDHISIVVKPTPNGFSYRFEVQEGVLKVIGGAVQSQMAEQGNR